MTIPRPPQRGKGAGFLRALQGACPRANKGSSILGAPQPVRKEVLKSVWTGGAGFWRRPSSAEKPVAFRAHGLQRSGFLPWKPGLYVAKIARSAADGESANGLWPSRAFRGFDSLKALPHWESLQSVAKAPKRKNHFRKRTRGSDFCFLRQLHLQPAVTYVQVSSLVCRFASLSCGLWQRSGSLLTLSTS